MEEIGTIASRMSRESECGAGSTDSDGHDPIAERRAVWQASVVAVTGLAALLRFAGLSAQPGLTHEEAAAGFAVLNLTAGGPAMWLSSPFTWLQSALVLALGLSQFSLRLAAALVGVATVPALAFAGRALLGSGSRSKWPPILAAFLLATDYWHILFSRLGTPAVWIPLSLVLAIGFAARALRARRRADTALALLFVGVATLSLLGPAIAARGPGAGSGSVAPAVTAGLSGFDSLRALSIALSVVGTLPPAGSIWVGGPAFDPLSGVLFWVGALLAIGRIGGLRVAFAGDGRLGRSSALPEAVLLICVVVSVGPAIVGVAGPDQSMLLAAAPALALLMAIGAEWIVTSAGRVRARDIGVVAVVTLVAGSSLLNGYAFFGRFLASDAGRALLLSNRAAAATQIVALAANGRVAVSTSLYSDESIHLLARDIWTRISPVGSDARPVSSGEPIVYAFAAEEKGAAELLGKRLGAEAQLGEIAGADGKPLLTVVRLVSETSAGARGPVALFLDRIDLVSARVEPAEIRPGGEVRVFLTWNNRRQIGDDYTMFVHLRRGSTETIDQFDGRPGFDRSPTFSWRPGVRVFDEVALKLPGDAAPGGLQVYLGLYRAESAQRLSATVDGQGVAGGEVLIGRVTVSP